jgi:hypothetical protein
MVARYGEAVKLTTAARILDRDRKTIYRMIEDGRLETACAGTMIDVYSIARYICQPARDERAARMRPQSAPAGRWAV